MTRTPGTRPPEATQPPAIAQPEITALPEWESPEKFYRRMMQRPTWRKLMELLAR